ncbi:hypothetical protein [Pontibacter rugosus]|uniref:Uncharacterized protein n=1 Tax=Pontibacter rugosus TaxID=1745966 RepID=A0ABW3SLP0_9BACT
MKKVLFSIAAMALFSFGCSSNTTSEEGHEHGPDSHQHEATSEEEHGHPHDSDGGHPHEQEEFTVAGDSAVTEAATETHSHDGQGDHQH